MAMHARPLNNSGNGRREAARAPRFVEFFNPIGRRLAGAGLMGPNALLTVRGRKSGVPRTTPVAFVEVGGRRWIIATFGDVNWARNLRAAGEATITIKRRPQHVQAIELSPTEGAAFFRDVLGPYVRRLPVGGLVLRLLGATDILTDPEGSAQRRPVFELKPAASAGDPPTPAGPGSR
jgi:deazaflavin-dependent oxidoreductase (nitroreductase family)